jgi:hypothetical protein
MVAILLSLVLSILGFISTPTQNVVTIPAMPQYSPEVAEEIEWFEFHDLAVAEYEAEFTALFNSYEFKQAKNGAPMIRRQGEKSFKFVARAK